MLLSDTWVALFTFGRGVECSLVSLFSIHFTNQQMKKLQKVTSSVIYSTCQIKCVGHLFCSSSNSSSSSWLIVSVDPCWNPCSSVISESRLSHSSILTSCRTLLCLWSALFLLSPWCFLPPISQSCSARLCHSKLRAIHLTQRGTEIDLSGERTEGCRDGIEAELGACLAEP